MSFNVEGGLHADGGGVPDGSAGPGESEVSKVSSVRVGLWGAPDSGKTTFLAALFLAADQLLRRRRREAPIAVRALDQASEEFKHRYSVMLAAGRRFPAATATVSPVFEWQFTGDLRGTRFAPRRLLPARHVPLDFVLRLRDIPGRYFGDEPRSDDSGEMDLIGELAQCDALVYLLDPSREAYNPDSYAYFEAVSTRLMRRVADEGRLVGGRLPHRLSVCITKFDDPRTFAESKLTGFVKTYPGTGQPYVPARDARRYFDAMCAGTRGTAEVVRDAIRATFVPERIHYYAVSSVGFAPGGTGSGWNSNDPSNLRRSEDGAFMLRDRPRPINVLEAVVDLERTIRETARQ